MAKQIKKLNVSRARLEVNLINAVTRLRQLSASITTQLNRKKPKKKFQNNYSVQLAEIKELVEDIEVQMDMVEVEFAKLEKHDQHQEANQNNRPTEQ